MLPTPWEIILEYCRGAANVTIAAPYIKANSLVKLLEEIGPQATVQCVTRWSPLDIRAAASDIECRTIVSNYGGSFRLHNRLHAKFYRFDEQILIGSANLTASGMSTNHPGNLEVLCVPDSSFDGSSFERALLQDSREVSDAEFLMWQRCPVDAIPKLEEMPAPSGSLTEDWRPMTRFPEYLWLAYTQQYGQINPDEQLELAHYDIQTLRIPLGLTRIEFANWISACLAASPFVEMVKTMTGITDRTAWREIASQWQITTAEAERSLTTTQMWLLHFEQIDQASDGTAA